VVRTRDDLVAAHGGLPARARDDLCAAFQTAVADVLAAKTARAIDAYLDLSPATPAIAVAGGVAANGVIRGRLRAVAEGAGLAFVAPPLALCTDNAAMIAWAGIERIRAGAPAGSDLVARPRWPLDDRAAPLVGFGRKGAKA
jgi:N6-L-threonylcarbamoyladenine synthase